MAIAPGINITPSTPVGKLRGVGSARASALARLGLRTVTDLLRHYPVRLEHEAAETAIRDLTEGSIGMVRGTVAATRWVGPPVRGRRAKGRFIVTLQAGGETMNLTWFNMAHLKEKIRPSMFIRVQGKVTQFNGYAQMVNPKWEVIEEEAQPKGESRLRPVYPATEGLPSGVIEALLADVIPKVKDQITDPLPAAVIEAHSMPTLATAFEWVHMPKTEAEFLAARRRLKFNELLLLQMGIALKRHYNQNVLKAPALRWSQAMHDHICKHFPFELTQGQQQVISEIAADLQKPQPMNRLLQGDVGSGKTVVALYAMLMAVADRKQAALMAPTELLAEQHFASISRMLEGSRVKVALLTAKTPGKTDVVRAIEQGEIDLVIGTQALLTKTVKFKQLAVIAIDEQHRFGVMQRAGFRGQGENEAAHHLVMTATPIPRTLSLTLLGDLDVSTITGMPPGRGTIITKVVGAEKADEVYAYVATRLAKGEQAYVVTPTIDESGHESAAQLKNVRAHTKMLQDKFYSDYQVAAVHGQLKPETRQAIMDKFRAGKIALLVATTVIEVGVDVPNATVMVVEHAERFGLAQLHQLRGRVGRGEHARSLCVLISEPTTDDAIQRLDALMETRDGFRLAELDLQIRGMGELFGTRQHGAMPLRLARIPEDMDLLKLAGRDAHDIVQADPQLQQKPHIKLRKVLLQQYGEKLGLIDVG